MVELGSYLEAFRDRISVGDSADHRGRFGGDGGEDHHEEALIRAQDVSLVPTSSLSAFLFWDTRRPRSYIDGCVFVFCKSVGE